MLGMAPPPSRRQQQSEQTRRDLLAVARRSFTDAGYTEAGITDIAAAARVTHGALYHHFPTKLALFTAVCEDLERELVERLRAGAADPNGARTALAGGCAAFLDACGESDFQRIVLLDAPSVLGWEAWHAMDARYGLALLTRAVEAEMRAGSMRAGDAAALAVVIHGALNEAGHAIARADDALATRARMGAAVDHVLDALQVPAEPGTSATDTK